MSIDPKLDKTSQHSVKITLIEIVLVFEKSGNNANFEL